MSFALPTCFAAATSALRIATAASFSLVAAAAERASIAMRTDWISDAHLSLEADNKALSELTRRISAADRQSLTANPPTKAMTVSTAMIVAVIAGLIM
jgi:hypothetical protein